MQLRLIVLGCALAIASSACTTNPNSEATPLTEQYASEQDRILGVLASQQAAWNAGNIDGFMEGYWPSPDLRFGSGGSVTKGWQDTRDRYKTNYSDRSLMGSLSFDELYVTVLSDDAAVVHGAWALERATDQPSGLFTLVFRKFDGEWKIVSDTTTSAD
ncbi:MAG: nuclear transport factor 2 family protein [Pseudomonadota bacterium]